jgi:hypothetical protein
VPWAPKGSGLTLLPEALAMTLIVHMPAAGAARILGVPDTRPWRVVHHYVEAAVDEMNLARPRARRHRRDGGQARAQRHHVARLHRRRPQRRSDR